MYRFQPCKIAAVLGNPHFTCKDVEAWLRANKKPSAELPDPEAGKKNGGTKNKRKVHRIQLYNILRSIFLVR